MKKWLVANYNMDHTCYFTNLRHHAGGGPCSTHDAFCQGNNKPDGLICGTPCQPYSRQRFKKRSSAPPTTHESYAVTFDDFFAILLDKKVKGGISEQVMGFNDKFTDAEIVGHGYGEEITTPLKLFIRRLNEEGYAASAIKLRLSDWIEEGHRDRLYIVYLNAELGGAEALSWIMQAIQEPFFFCLFFILKKQILT